MSAWQTPFPKQPNSSLAPTHCTQEDVKRHLTSSEFTSSHTPNVARSRKRQAAPDLQLPSHPLDLGRQRQLFQAIHNRLTWLESIVNELQDLAKDDDSASEDDLPGSVSMEDVSEGSLEGNSSIPLTMPQLQRTLSSAFPMESSAPVPLPTMLPFVSEESPLQIKKVLPSGP